MRSATLEVLGVFRSFSRPRISNDNPYPEALFRTEKYRLVHLSLPFASKEAASQWAAAFMYWYEHEHLLSAIKFVTLSRAIAAKPLLSTNGVEKSMSRPASAISDVGSSRFAAGVNFRCMDQ
jgi:hypothetical protein